MKKITRAVIAVTCLLTPFYAAHADNQADSNPYAEQIQYVNKIIGDINNQSLNLNAQYAQSAIQLVWSNFEEAFKNPSAMIATPQFAQMNVSNTMTAGNAMGNRMGLQQRYPSAQTQQNITRPSQQDSFFSNNQAQTASTQNADQTTAETQTGTKTIDLPSAPQAPATTADNTQTSTTNTRPLPLGFTN